MFVTDEIIALFILENAHQISLDAMTGSSSTFWCMIALLLPNLVDILIIVVCQSFR